MTLPVHPMNIDDDRRALAPYNFVPLPEKVVAVSRKQLPDQGVFHNDRLTGWIDCELETASPVYIRAGSPPGENESKKENKQNPEFFYINDADEPVIPGSSIRGMLRAMVEIVSYAKVTPVSDAGIIYRAVGDTTSHGQRYRDRLMQDDGNKYFTPRIKGGYMKKRKGEWYIRPAKTVGGTTYAHIRIKERLLNSNKDIYRCGNGETIYIETGPYDYQKVKGGFLHIKYARVLRASATKQSGYRPATLAKSGNMFSKRSEAVIYEADDNATPLPLTDEILESYLDQVSKEQEDILGSEKGVLNDGHPVFYVQDTDGNVDFFGHCRMFRLPYLNSARRYIPDALGRPETIDLAEAIFGYTKEAKAGNHAESAYAGRVCFSDARLVPGQNILWLSPGKTITPRILAGPKPTTFQHYLVQTQPNKIKIGKTKDGKPKYETRLSDYAAPTPGETVIRGHKLYWHKGAVELKKIEEPGHVKDDDKQHTRIRPLRQGVRFQFRIAFENLSHVELGAVLWVLNVAGDDKYRLKIGMGKPLGMGAIKMTHRLNVSDRSSRYRKLFENNAWFEPVYSEHQLDAKTMEAVQQMTLHEGAIAEFEKFILNQLNEKQAKRINELDRIRSFLAMLSWPGPDPSRTRYMEIERHDPGSRRGKRNEYKGRPVLPPALLVAGKTPRDIPGPAETEKTTAGQGTAPDSSSRDDVYRGKVKSFGLGPNKSYGYIVYEKEKNRVGEIFLHKSRLSKGVETLEPGQEVFFRIGRGIKGMQAVDVRPIKTGTN